MYMPPPWPFARCVPQTQASRMQYQAKKSVAAPNAALAMRSTTCRSPMT